MTQFVLKKTVLVLTFSFLLIHFSFGSIFSGNATVGNDIQQIDSIGSHSKDEHLIYGFSEFSDGWVTTGAVVYAVSEYGTIINVVYSPGNWEVDCNNQETPWPVGTEFNVYIKGCCGHVGWFGETQGTLPETDIDMGTIILYPNQKPNPPSIVEYPPGLQVDSIGEFTVQGVDPDELHKIKYRFEWDVNGTHERSNFTEYLENGECGMKKHSWDSPGIYIVKAQATDEFGLCSEWSEGVQITVYDSNFAPNPPIITGPDVSQKNIEQTFSISTTDPENEQIYYQVDWGDNETTNWLGPFLSGEVLTISHTWTAAGFYSITARAKDNLDIVGSWSEPKQIQVTEPEITIQNISIGIGKISFDICNSGTGSALNVTWTITLNGQNIFMGQESSGLLLEIPAHEKSMLSSSFIFGFGPVTIQLAATAENYSSDEQDVDANLFAFFIIT